MTLPDPAAHDSSDSTADADIVVVGSGAAGLCGALTAADRGAKVLVLEATDYIGGTTAFSGALLWAPFNKWQAAAGIADSRATAEAYLRRCIGDRAADPRWGAFLDNINGVLDFLEAKTQLRFALTRYPDSYGEWADGRCTRHVNSRPVKVSRLGAWRGKVRAPARVASSLLTIMQMERIGMGNLGDVRKMLPLMPRMMWNRLTHRRGMGLGFVAALLEACLDRGVGFRLGARVVQLVSEGGCVAGVVAEQQGSRTSIQAKRGVLIACGGFDHDEELMRRHLPGPIRDTQTPPVNLGDNLRLAGQVGAKLAFTDEAWYLPGFRPPGANPGDGRKIPGFAMIGDRMRPHQIWVNRSGRRFVNECGQNAANSFYAKDASGDLPNLPCFSVFDAQHRAKYTVLAVLRPDAPDPPWLAKADSLRDLAGRIGVDPAGLEASVLRFNQPARDGKDPEFGRGAGEYDRYFGDRKARFPNLGPIEKPPFYAFEVSPSSVGTKGGMMTNEWGEVVDRAGIVIEGLYAAGNASAAFNGPITVAAGCTIPPALVMAHLAARRMCSGNE